MSYWTPDGNVEFALPVEAVLEQAPFQLVPNDGCCCLIVCRLSELLGFVGEVSGCQSLDGRELLREGVQNPYRWVSKYWTLC